MAEIEEIKVLWEGPFTIDQILDDKIDADKYYVKNTDVGLYQVYGSHPIYGNGVLVYIGRTVGKNGFKSRLKNRWVIENGNDSENIQIYLGTVFSDAKKLLNEEVLARELIEKVEVLLINSLKPAYNSSNIQSANEKFTEERYIVHNEGNYRSLVSVLDSKYQWENYLNFSIVNKIAKTIGIEIDDDDEYYGFILNESFLPNINNIDFWIGVDYEIWDKLKIPLTLQIETEDEAILKKVEHSNMFTSYGEDEPVYYLELDIESLAKDEDGLVESVRFIIDDVCKKLGLM